MASQLDVVRRVLRRPLLPLLAVALAGAWCVWPQQPAIGDATTTAAPVAAPKGLKIRGAATCASASCHGQDKPAGSKGAEYTTWMTYDRHANAYSVLMSDRSRRMLRLYRGLAKDAPSHPERETLCLKCHAQTSDLKLAQGHGSTSPLSYTSDVAPANGGLVLSDGVSCENCHGPAEKWLTIHYGADWKSRSDADKVALGFTPTKNLTWRLKQCATCHVGTADQEVNHDLIAAGHPRLNFEAAGYHVNFPRHWDPRDEDARLAAQHPGELHEARLWAVGQVAAAQASVELLHARAKNHQADAGKAPWPEFSEYDCYACHHNLKAESWRQGRGYAERLPGALLWNEWYLTQTLALAGKPGLGSEDAAASLKKLRGLMASPAPAADAVESQAKQTSADLAAWLDQLERKRYDDSLVRKLQAEYRADDKAPGTWDQAAQRYLALSALHYALPQQQRDPAQAARLKAQMRDLSFPKNYDSPLNFKPSMLERRSK